MLQNITGVETTFGFNLLKTFGVQQSYVLSPLTMLLALSLIRKDRFDSKVAKEYSNLGFKDQEIEFYLDHHMDDIIVRSDTGIKKQRNFNQTRIMFNGGWEWKMQGQLLNRFHSSKVRSKITAFLVKYNDHFLLNVDDVFKLIILPYDDHNLQFFVLLPVRRYGLKSALKKLTKDRFETLLREAEREFVNVAMPKFDNLELLRNAKSMGLQLPIKVNLEYKQKPRVAGLLYRPENREPYYFHADHPFVFGILRSSKPVFLGIYK